MAVIRGESCFEKNAFEDTENPQPPLKLHFWLKNISGKYSRYRKNFCFILKLFLHPILFHGKLSFDNLTYFKLYGNLNQSEGLKWPKWLILKCPYIFSTNEDIALESFINPSLALIRFWTTSPLNVLSLISEVTHRVFVNNVQLLCCGVLF